MKPIMVVPALPW